MLATRPNYLIANTTIKECDRRVTDHLRRIVCPLTGKAHQKLGDIVQGPTLGAGAAPRTPTGSQRGSEVDEPLPYGAW